LHLDGLAVAAGIDGHFLQPRLDRDAGVYGVGFGLEDGEDAVTQQLDDAAAVLLEGLGQGRGELRDEPAGGLVAEPLENAGAPDEVSKDDRGHGWGILCRASRAATRATRSMPTIAQQKKASNREVAGLGWLGRRGGIRTRDPLHPMQVRYQAALHAEARDYSLQPWPGRTWASVRG